MALAGTQAMTTPRRMLMRVSAAHGLGYWAFQHNINQSPLNPPNAFLVMHRERDRSDQHIGSVINNPSFSSDGDLTSADWNMIWRRGVQSSAGGMQSLLMEMADNLRLYQQFPYNPMVSR